MSLSTGRFNLRTRKSVKLFGQIKCTSCGRFYFPSENSDDENDDVDQSKTGENLCCNCEEEKRQEPPPKRRAIQGQNGAPSLAPKIIKQEKIDLDYSPTNDSGHCDRLSSIPNQDRMVQIHSSELLTQPLPLNINSEYYADFIVL